MEHSGQRARQADPRAECSTSRKAALTSAAGSALRLVLSEHLRFAYSDARYGTHSERDAAGADERRSRPIS
jgi:hypothetical protein